MSDSTKAVFLSYASQDAEAAKRIAEALRAAGVEVWFDAEGGLEHGDEWDAKIRRQIKECVLFLPIISANTQAREEGYFRIEWELAAQRALGIASGVAFILPVVIDDTREPDALVPDRFRTVQWTKLPGGELTPEVKARFLKLWSHRTGVIKHLSGEQASHGLDRATGPGSAGADNGKALSKEQENQDPGTTAALSKPGWKAYAGLAVAIFSLVGVVGWWMLGREGAPATLPAVPLPPASGLPSPASAAAPAAVSEARLLVEKARALIDSLESVRDDYKLAEELVAQARARDSSDGEVWAVEAQVHQRYIQRGWDTSDARREAARVATQRALRLDPKSFEVRFAQQGLLAYTGREGAEKERLLRELRLERPADHRVLRELGSTIDRLGRKEEGIAFMDEAAALPGGDPLALYNKSMAYWFAGRMVEAEAAIQASLAQRPFTSALLISVWYAMVLHGDLAGARVILERVPPAELLEDRGCYFAYFLHLLASEPDAALAVLRAVPRDWINDNWYRGPKGRLAGDALNMAGRAEAAAVEWRAALKLVDDRLAADPTNGNLQSNRIRLLAKLGERAAAEQQFAVLVQMHGIDPAGPAPVPAWVTDICIDLGRKADAMRLISLGLNRERHAVDYTAALLRLDPQFDPLRGEPEFQKLITQAAAIEQAAAARPPRDWPKNPELKKAIDLLDRFDAIPEDIRLAEEIVQGVLDKAPTDPETVTAMARVQTMWLLRGWDRSSDRYLKAQRVAERAVQLASDDPEALAALMVYLYQRGSDFARARQLIERAIELDPGSARLNRLRNDLLNADRTVPREELFASLERTLARFPRDALVHYDASRHYRNAGRWEDSEREADTALAIAPVANAMVWKARTEFGLRNNLPAMKAALDRVPARVRSIERTVFAYFIYAVMSGDHAVGVDALNAMPEPWMIDFDYRGPKALPLAALLELQGKPALARVQYEVALREVKQRQVAESDDIFLRQVEAWVLHGLGRDDEARAAIRIFNESIERPYRVSRLISWWFHPIAGNLVLGERATALALLREACETPGGRETVRRFLASDPRLAAFRDDAEIKALLAEPAGAKP